MRCPHHSRRGYGTRLALALVSTQFSPCRIDDDCSPGQTLRSPRPSPGVPKDQTRLGLMCWCSPHVSQCHKYQEGWPGPPRWSFHHHCQKWMGISGGTTVSGSLRRHRLRDSFRWNPLRPHSLCNHCPNRTDHFKGCLSVPQYYPHLR